MRKTISMLSGMILVSALSGCGTHGYYPFLYHPVISQGNVINPAAFKELKPGMNKAEVVNLVGEPILQTPLSSNVWHYIYTVQVNNKMLERQQITLNFRGDSLVNVVGP